MSSQADFLDRLVVFLAKRDGIDKLIKTFQYVSRLIHWRLLESHPDLARRAALFSAQCGISRKAFRCGRFLTGYNALRKTSYQSSWLMKVLSFTGHSGDMVYFFFDHFTWMAKAGLLESKLAGRFSHISASGEIFLYVAFIAMDIGLIQNGRKKLKKMQVDLSHQQRLYDQALTRLGIDKHSRFSPFSSAETLEGKSVSGINQSMSMLSSTSGALRTQFGNETMETLKALEDTKAIDGEVKQPQELELIDEEIIRLKNEIATSKFQQLMRVLGIAANLADLVIAISDVEPNSFCNHSVTLGISGLVSAWAGWYRNWPFQK